MFCRTSRRQVERQQTIIRGRAAAQLGDRGHAAAAVESK
jgi:hypothetical protein